MKTKVAVLIAALMVGVSIFWAQTHPETKPAAPAKTESSSCGRDHSDLLDELTETNVYVSRMQSRVVMIRNSAGVIENPQLRNALQVDADMWQDEIDHLKQQMNRLQAVVDRCEAREKIKESAK